jgi:outer membrane biosynthesis protein TonB
LFGSAPVKEITGENPRAAVAVPQIASPQQVAPKPALKAVEPTPAPAPVAEQPAPVKRGFGASKPAAPVKAATPKPAPAPAATATSAAALADSIAALVGEVNSDDA